jgi:DNA invertase Pin-like site-specific DNA recombinase
MRVATYLRQSQDRSGEGYGIDRQREDVQRLCEARGWTVAAEFIDNDVSALSRKPRPQFTEMMRRVDDGEFDIIAARHMDRLLRRLAELESVMERCQKTNTAIVTASDGVDTSTDGGRLVARILSSVAQGEVERKAARQRSAVIQAAKQGRWVGGRRAFGYEKDGKTIRECEAVLIRQGYVDVLAGETPAEIARRWTASGIPTGQGTLPWTRSSVWEVLCNPRNAGLRRHRTYEQRADIRKDPELGIVSKAEWTALVDESTWRAVIRILCDPSRQGRKTGGKGLLTGIALCGVCGNTVHRGGSSAARGMPVYRCRSGGHVARKSEPVDEWVSELAIARLSRPDAAAAFADSKSDVSRLMAEADVLRRRLSDLAEDYPRMTREAFRTANDATMARLAEVESEIAGAAGGNSSIAKVATAVDKRAAWESLSVAQQRKIIDTIMVVRLHLTGRGVRAFRPESVEVTPK